MSDPLQSRSLSENLPRGGWRVAFAGSVLLNCFVLGLLAGPMLRPHPPFKQNAQMIDHLTEGLSDDDAAALRKIYAVQEPMLTEGHQSMDGAMHKIAAALEQPEVDQASLHQGLDAIGAAHQKVHEGMVGLITNAATGLSPSGRHIFAENSLHTPHREGPPGGPDGPHPSP
jgi:uncharacterized membrane protein